LGKIVSPHGVLQLMRVGQETGKKKKPIKKGKDLRANTLLQNKKNSMAFVKKKRDGEGLQATGFFR